MSTAIILGAQWGDEGKGKLVDVLTEKAQVVARYQGGHNAGHTVVIGGETYILHLIPSGILHKEKLCIIGNGTVVDPLCLLEEIDGLLEKGLPVGDNLLISKSAHLIMPYHMAIEGAGEATKGSKKIGTTGRGIGPAYVDKMNRTGIRVGELLHPTVFREKLEKNLAHIETILRNVYGIDDPQAKASDADAIYDSYMKCAERLAPHIADTDVIVNDAIDQGKNVLFEGAQGVLLDIDHGTYPFVTSSSAAAGGVCTGLGVGPTRVDRVVGVVKAYTTRVGSGPFPTELDNDLGEQLRSKGGEFGATTGRARRCGWLDMVALRHAVRVCGLTGIAITKLDILDGLDEIKYCVGYKYKDTVLKDFPKESFLLEEVTPVYESVPGWQESTQGLKSYDQLPQAAKDYLKLIEDSLRVSIDMVSTGAGRDELITINGDF